MGSYIDYADVVADLPDLDSKFTESIVESYISISEQIVNDITNNRNSWLVSDITEVQDGDKTDIINLKRFPVNSITSIVVDEVNIDSDNRYDYLELGYIRLKNRVSSEKYKQNITIVYNAGYADKAAIPKNIKELCLLFTEEQILSKSSGGTSITEKKSWSIEDFKVENSTSENESKGYSNLLNILKNRIDLLACADIDLI